MNRIEDSDIIDEVNDLADNTNDVNVIERPTGAPGDSDQPARVTMKRVTTARGRDYTRVSTHVHDGSLADDYVLDGWVGADSVLADVIGDDETNPNHPAHPSNDMVNHPYTPPQVDYSDGKRHDVQHPGVFGNTQPDPVPALNPASTGADADEVARTTDASATPAPNEALNDQTGQEATPAEEPDEAGTLANATTNEHDDSSY